MKNVLIMGPGRILGQVLVRPANVEPSRVLSLLPGREASRPGGVLGRAIYTAQLYESWRMKVSKGKVLHRYNPVTLRVTCVISEA